ncbi:LamG-like jellyroll fold domain-containing protein [Streptomyces sp. DH37]|uniref:LamG-like jellyroll fold domain-containing protein n=1 Tax=Streptomyces sp. DH37 TaxID=3040122 RepID=UPI0024430697|nr:LamG-like jellyroll fold domain-containing protein [Streptomyces sp. DH37]MDG9700912.1 LamG domain-containing protein [Streptomyces sp. DH37]
MLSALPALALPAVPAHAGVPTEALTEQSASQQAATSGEPVEVVAARTEYSQTMANPDGTFTLTQSTEPQRARAGDGTWRDIDITLEKRSDGRIGPRAAVVDLSFSGGGSGAQMLSLGLGGQRLKLGWPAALPAPVLDGATATYPDVLEGVDLQLTATAEGYREVLVVKTAQAAANPALEEITLTAAGEGLSVVPGEGGGLRAVDADGNPVFRGAAGQMWDSAGDGAVGPQTQLLPTSTRTTQDTADGSSPAAEPGEGDATAELPVTVGDGAVSVEPDLELLRGSETVYPVFIDPSVGLGKSEWTKLSSDGDKFWKFSEPKGVGRCGTADGYACGSGYVDRMYFEYGAPNLAGKHVLDATFRAYETWSFNCTPYWVDLERTDNISEGTRWPGPKQLDQMGDRYVSAGRGSLCSPEQPDSWIEFNDNPEETDENLTSTVRALADGKISRLTLMLRAKDESEPRAWKRFAPNAELKVWYVHRPGVPASVGAIPGTGTRAYCRASSDPLTVTVDTPTLQASVQTKVEAHEGEEEGYLQAEFVMQRSSTGTTSGTWSQVWSGYKPDTGWHPDGTLEKITTSKLADGGLYRFRARTQSHWSYSGKSGDLFSPYSSWCYLRIDTLAPRIPVITSGGPYLECTTNLCNPYGGPGKPGTFTFKPNAADNDIRAYRWRLLSSDAAATKQVNATSVNAPVTVKDVVPGLSGTQTLSVEASDLQLGKDGRVRWGPPQEFTFKVELASGPTGRWRFDDGAPGSGVTLAKDTGEVGVRHDAVLRDEAGTGWSTLGRRGAGDYSLWLNDSSSNPDLRGYASTDGVAVNTEGSFTVSAWVYLTDASANRVVLSAPGDYGSAFTLYYSSHYKKWVFNRTDQDKNGPVYLRSLADASEPPVRVWTHLAGVFNTHGNADKSNDTIQLFVNGQPQGEPLVLAKAASTYTPWAGNRNLQIGRSKVGGTYGEYFRGRIDEVAVWQEHHEPEQVLGEYRLTKDGVPTNELVAHWDATTSPAGGTQIVESPEDPDNPANTAFPYRNGPLTLSGTGATLAGEDATALVLNGTSGYASTGGPMVDETGSFTVSARVRLNKDLLAAKPAGYRGLVAAQATPAGKESSWALWVEKYGQDLYLWKFGRVAVDANGTVLDTATAAAQDPIGAHEWDTWIDVTGVFDATAAFTDDSGQQRFGVAQLFVGQFAYQGEEDPGLAIPQQGSGTLSAGRGSSGGTTGHHLPGDLAKLRLWVGAMTPDQVTSQIAQPAA